MKLFCLCVILISGLLDAQSVTEKYNVRQQRIEYYDVIGALIGYSKENSKYNRLEYYDCSGILVKSYQQTSMLFLKTGLDNDSALNGIRRWNYLRQRYEMFDSLGAVMGYYKYDGLSHKWNYYSGS